MESFERNSSTAVGPDLSSDLAVFNRWLSLTRMRAATALALFILGMSYFDISDVQVAPALLVCAGMILFSLIALWSGVGTLLPQSFFYAQSVVDIAGITVGIAVLMPGHPPPQPRYFTLVYVLVVVASSLTSARAGLVCATLAAIGHLTLIARSDPSVAALTSLPAVTPVFLFFLVAQQCFFYAGHLADKNRTLVTLAGNLERSRQRLADLVQIARA